MDFLEIGRIVKLHGLKGRMKVLSYVESDGMFNTLDNISVGSSADHTEQFAVKSLQVKGNCFYLELAGIDSIDQARKLVGSSVFASAKHLEALPEDEYYWRELIGLEVVTEEGTGIGRLKRIFPTGSNDVFVCGNGKVEKFLPVIGEVVRKIDRERGIITVRLLEGL
jgi:16S rRNA processing protein RimM